jgi:quinol monooxygenase YgiN
MFMRLVQLNAVPDHEELIRQIYDGRVIPRLQQVTGCISAQLIQGIQQPGSFVSMTLWRGKDDVAAYEKSGMYKELLAELEPYLSESSEWKMQLSDNLELTYAPVREKPVAHAYDIRKQKQMKPRLTAESAGMWVRLVSARIRKDKVEWFTRIYQQEIIPALQDTDGCLYAYLVENTGRPEDEHEEAMSVTIWENKEKADRYEKSGLYDRLLQKMKPAFSQLSQWQLSLEKGKKIKTSDDITIKRYAMVTGKQFQ